MSTKTAAGAATALMVAVGLALLAFFGMGGPQLAAATCDTNSFNLMTEAMKSVSVEQRYTAQEALAHCVDLDKHQGERGGSSSATTTSKVPLPEGKRTWEYLANRPVSEKVAINAFGPKIALAESNNGKLMGELNASEAYEEHRFRLKLDPMQTAAAECGTAPTTPCKIGEVDEKTKLYASDFAAWDRANDQLLPRLDKMKKEVRRITAGTPVPMQYALPGEIPLVVMDDHVIFPYDIMVIVYTDVDGREYSARLECGFQWLKAAGRPMPKASKGFTRTPEGTPVVEKPPSSTETPPVTTTKHETTSTPPVTTTTNTSECPNGQKPPCPKTSATGAPGVGTPTDNSVGTPTTATSQTSPLQPTNPPVQTTRTTAPPAGGNTPTSATATISAPPPGG